MSLRAPHARCCRPASLLRATMSLLPGCKDSQALSTPSHALPLQETACLPLRPSWRVARRRARIPSLPAHLASGLPVPGPGSPSLRPCRSAPWVARAGAHPPLAPRRLAPPCRPGVLACDLRRAPLARTTRRRPLKPREGHGRPTRCWASPTAWRRLHGPGGPGSPPSPSRRPGPPRRHWGRGRAWHAPTRSPRSKPPACLTP